MIRQSFITACYIVIRIVLDKQNATSSRAILTQSIDKGCMVVAHVGIVIVQVVGIPALLELLRLFLGVEDICRIVCR